MVPCRASSSDEARSCEFENIFLFLSGVLKKVTVVIPEGMYVSTKSRSHLRHLMHRRGGRGLLLRLSRLDMVPDLVDLLHQLGQVHAGTASVPGGGVLELQLEGII